MRIIIIGGTGHVGTFLAPRLVNAGHHVISVSRNERRPYIQNAAWHAVKEVKMDRNAPGQQDVFGKRIAEMDPDIVIDMICFNRKSAAQMVNALEGSIRQYLFCGTIWVYGGSVMIPTEEDQPRKPLSEYGKNKADAEAYLLGESKQNGFPATILHPGHIVGPGWKPVNPAGNLNPEVFKKLANGEQVLLPNLGMETLHHVHADDVAQAFELAISHASAAKGESFNIVSAKAMSMRGYAETIAEWLDKPANLKFLDWQTWKEYVSDEDAQITWDHLIHSPCCSIEKARRLLQYKPRYSSIAAIQEALEWQERNENLLK
jgi:nucleoside-diphosphate-sugar epimerase